MSERATFVGPERAAEKMARARAIPGVKERSAQVRAEMVETDRVHAAGLAEIRKAADLTQVALATQMGVAQTVISRLERQHDMLLSTLTQYLTAAGDHPRIVVTVDGQDIELDLANLVG
ncbi:helix-turn-helix domain-containing protein [Modestobacter lacusdianchii]